jgi:hypothetical protein
MLDSGSSRVFNCNDRALKLQSDGVPEPYFFKMKKLHGIVLIKEAILDTSNRDPGDPVIGSKLYIPYNQLDIYAGGRSVFYHDPRLLEVLNELLGLRGAVPDEDDLRHDVKMLGILDGLPSLDGFLMRDALELEGISANEQYFEVSGAERATIRDFVRLRFEPLVRRACGEGGALAGKVTQLIDKIWEAKDKEALAPLIRAFHFPDDEALSIFASWKGINFYTFEYARAKPQREQFGLWLRDKWSPRNFVARSELDFLRQSRRTTAERLRSRWNTIEAISREYDALYDRFLSTPDGVGDFVGFLRRSREIYWSMGEALSKIDHAIHCWDAVSKAYEDRRLPADKLVGLFDMLQTILAGARDRTETAVVWQ